MQTNESTMCRESILDAVRRHGLADLLDLALRQNDRHAAALLLRSVGADSEAAERLLNAVFARMPNDCRDESLPYFGT